MNKFWCKQLLMSSSLDYILADEEAIDEHLQVGDLFKVNEGMGKTEYRLTGFPMQTEEYGEFTLTSRINKIGTHDGLIFYRADVKWPKSKLKFEFEDEHSDANISYYGDGKSVDVNLTINVDDATINTYAGVTKSLNLYQGDYVYFPVVEILPDATYYMTLAGEVVHPYDLPKIVPFYDQVFSLVIIKNNKQRYSKIVPVRGVKPLIVKTFTINPTPADATVTYTINSCSHDWVQTGGTVYCYGGEVVQYTIQKEGYEPISDEFVVPTTVYVRDYSINVPMTQDPGSGGIEPVGGDDNFD